MIPTRPRVFILGGGPAGSIAATILARGGLEVVLCERTSFPRFHIGESLLPASLKVLARLDVDLSNGPYLRKQGAEFRDETTGQHQVYSFADALPGSPDHAYQVERSIFDSELLQLARTAGAEIREQEVVAVEFTKAGVGVHTNRGLHPAEYFIDASGGALFMARRNKSMQAMPELGRAASFQHFGGIKPEHIAAVNPDGNIVVLRVEQGWAWVIPLHGGKLSVGVVRRDGTVKPSSVEQVVAGSPLIRSYVEGCEPSSPRIVSNYSYRNARPSGERFCCIGDAACFLDPVFSSGVSLALLSASAVAERLLEAFAAGTQAEAELMIPVWQHMSVAYRSFYALIHRFYNGSIFDNLFLSSEPDPLMRRGLVSILAGDVWREDNEFQRVLLSAHRHEPPPFTVE